MSTEWHAIRDLLAAGATVGTVPDIDTPGARAVLAALQKQAAVESADSGEELTDAQLKERRECGGAQKVLDERFRRGKDQLGEPERLVPLRRAAVTVPRC